MTTTRLSITLLLLLLLLFFTTIIISDETKERITVRDENTDASSPHRIERIDITLEQTPTGPVPVKRIYEIKGAPGVFVEVKKVPYDRNHPYFIEDAPHHEHHLYNDIWNDMEWLFSKFTGTMRKFTSYGYWKNSFRSLMHGFGAIPLGSIFSFPNIRRLFSLSSWLGLLTTALGFIMGLSLVSMAFGLAGIGLLYWLLRPARTMYFNGRQFPLPEGHRFYWGRWKLPLIGDTIDYIRNSFAFLDNRAKKFGNISFANIWGSRTIVLSGQEGMQKFYNSELVTRKKIVPSKYFAGLGTSWWRSTDERKLKTREQILSKAIGDTTTINNYIGKFGTIIDKYIDSWRDVNNFRFLDEARMMLVEMNARFLLGTTSQMDDIITYNRSILRGSTAMRIPIPYITAYGNYLLNRRRANKLYTEIVDYHIKGRSKFPEKYPYLEQGSAMDIICQEMKKSTNYGKTDAIADIYSLIFDSSRVIGLALTDMLWCFSKYPDVLNKARKEVLDNIPDGSAFDLQKIESLPYLSAVVDEVRRFFGFVPGMFGVAKKSFEVNGYVVPKGYSVLGGFYSTNHDYELWSQPYSFRPERFLSGENNKDIFSFNNQSWSWVPHGSGVYQKPSADLTGIILKLVAIRLFQRGCKWDVTTRDVQEKIDMWNPQISTGLNIRNFRLMQMSHA